MICSHNNWCINRGKPQKQAASLIEQAEEEDMDPDEVVEELLEQLDSKSILCFSITTSGVASGPTSSMVYVAVDFCPAKAIGRVLREFRDLLGKVMDNLFELGKRRRGRKKALKRVGVMEGRCIMTIMSSGGVTGQGYLGMSAKLI